MPRLLGGLGACGRHFFVLSFRNENCDKMGETLKHVPRHQRERHTVVTYISRAFTEINVFLFLAHCDLQTNNKDKPPRKNP
jgi:hypothetical protein